jgi:hypothetical protein
VEVEAEDLQSQPMLELEVTEGSQQEAEVEEEHLLTA